MSKCCQLVLFWHKQLWLMVDILRIILSLKGEILVLIIKDYFIFNLNTYDLEFSQKFLNFKDNFFIKVIDSTKIRRDYLRINNLHNLKQQVRFLGLSTVNYLWSAALENLTSCILTSCWFWRSIKPRSIFAFFIKLSFNHCNIRDFKRIVQKYFAFLHFNVNCFNIDYALTFRIKIFKIYAFSLYFKVVFVA